MEVDVEGIFVKHDFDHVILDEEEVEKYTQRKLAVSTMKQTLMMEFGYDVQVLIYFMSCHFPDVGVFRGREEVEQTLRELDQLTKNLLGVQMPQSDGPSANYDLRILIGGRQGEGQHAVEGVTILYFYKAQKLELSWITSPRNDSLADSVALLVLSINENTSPQLVQMMDAVKNQRKEQDQMLGLQLQLESYFAATTVKGHNLEVQADQFGKLEIDLAKKTLSAVFLEDALIDLDSQEVEADERVRTLRMMRDDATHIITKFKESLVPPAILKCC
mmetsp:Transcript_11809/g.19953  ORF Transcript_11809/g.19953 Transcript_11809/m.19953 type:complete len:275 (-) Transcript_11809:10-834(-)